jgi:hypothetical protein
VEAVHVGHKLGLSLLDTTTGSRTTKLDTELQETYSADVIQAVRGGDFLGLEQIVFSDVELPPGYIGFSLSLNEPGQVVFFRLLVVMISLGSLDVLYVNGHTTSFFSRTPATGFWFVLVPVLSVILLARRQA